MNSLKDNFLNPDAWLRLMLILVFLVVRWVLMVVINVLIAAQFLFVIFSGSKNENLDTASCMMSAYLTQIVEYQTFVSDIQPWPLSEFPDSDISSVKVSFEDS